MTEVVAPNPHAILIWFLWLAGYITLPFGDGKPAYRIPVPCKLYKQGVRALVYMDLEADVKDH